MKALVFDKSKTDWETSRGFDPSTSRYTPVRGARLVDIPEPVLGLTAFFLLAIIFLINLTAFSPLRAGRQFLIKTVLDKC